MKTMDVTALGELLIDFAQKDTNTFEGNPGGAPCNVLAMLNKVKKKTAFIGKVGNDMFGNQLKAVIEEIGIDARGLVVDDSVRTTLAFVKFDETGDRDFSFYRNPGADMMLKESEVDLDLIKDSKIFHFGTLSMTHEGVREATKKAVACAKENGAIISFDPNLRPPLWDDLDEAREQMKAGCALCDFIKIEDEELKFMTGKDTIEEGVKDLQDAYDMKMILVTSGPKGAQVFCNGHHVYRDAFLNRNTCDTTGAGDTFCGVCLSYLCDTPFENFDEEKLADMLTHANAAASIVTTRIGALKSMPTMEEVDEYIAGYRLP
ncbi:carbohydrate kinase [uncultured Dubosiella sp.]|uniref:carbohydrate kinase family protein n=1 Tax=uncultured Dubosiella sp. TaxID=1937011 RepID=UPI0025B5D9EC|nr:carbohydrate kinase [uncultured Dubosiella sp.]